MSSGNLMQASPGSHDPSSNDPNNPISTNTSTNNGPQKTNNHPKTIGLPVPPPKLNPTHLLQQLDEILIRVSGADPSQIKSEARLIDDIGIDSLGFYEIMIEADEQLGVKILEEDLLKFRTVGDIRAHLQSMGQTNEQAG